MTTRTTIEWTDTTWNPTVGCSRVSEGCRNCYAERMAARVANVALARAQQDRTERERAYIEAVKLKPKGSRALALQQWSGKVETIDSALEEPLHWREPRRVFVDSMSDLFHEAVPFEFIHRVWDVMKQTPQNTYQILTKRPERMAEVVQLIYRKEALGHAKGFWNHVWLGTSVEDQATADDRIPHLLRCPAAVRFVSAEPLLGPLDVSEYLRCPECRWEGEPDEVPDDVVASSTCTPCGHGETCPCIHWVIVGGESGPDARPMHPHWVRSIRDQCVAARALFFFKQWGQWSPNCLCPTRWAHAAMSRPTPGPPGVMFKCGKKAAGRVLDGRTWDEMPEVTHG